MLQVVARFLEMAPHFTKFNSDFTNHVYTIKNIIKNTNVLCDPVWHIKDDKYADFIWDIFIFMWFFKEKIFSLQFCLIEDYSKISR